MPRPPDQGGFSPRGTRRVARAANQVERFDHFRRNGSGSAPFASDPKQRVGFLVRVTDQPSLGDPDLYPGLVVEFDGYLSGAAEWSDGEECWIVRPPSDTAGLATGSEGAGELVGVRDDDERLIFAMKPGTGGGGPVGASVYEPWAVDLISTDVTRVCTAVIPSTGKYWIGYTLTGQLDGSVGAGIASILAAYTAGGSLLSYGKWAFSHVVGNTTGVTPGTASAFLVLDLPAGAELRLLALVALPSGGSFTACKVGTLDLTAPYHAPAALGGVYFVQDTGITYHKLGADPGLTVPPPPSGIGEISGHVQNSLGANLSGRTITLSGTASATTTTDVRGNYTFSSLADGSYTSTLSLLGGETSTKSVDGATSAGNAGTVTVAGDTHVISFFTTP